jgi:hypothetical protein
VTRQLPEARDSPGHVTFSAASTDRQEISRSGDIPERWRRRSGPLPRRILNVAPVALTQAFNGRATRCRRFPHAISRLARHPRTARPPPWHSSRRSYPALGCPRTARRGRSHRRPLRDAGAWKRAGRQRPQSPRGDGARYELRRLPRWRRRCETHERLSSWRCRVTVPNTGATKRANLRPT